MKAILSSLHQKKYYIVFVLAFFLSAHIYSQYFSNLSYPDEFDNFANSWLMARGMVPYRDFFSHHLPTLIYLGAPLELFFHSKIAFRLEIFSLYFLFFLITFKYLKGYFKFSIIPFMIFSSYAIALFGGQQFADGVIWAITLLSAFFIVAKNLGNTLTKKETVIFSLLMLATVLSSPAHILGFAMLITLHLISQKKQKGSIHKNLNNLKIMLLSISIPSAILLLYLIGTKSLVVFYQSTIQFNNEIYYYHLYPTTFVPVKFIDYYLHTCWDFYNHLYQISKIQGPYLISFLSSLKSIIFHPSLITNSGYLKIIFSMFYENFLTFEVLILIFYLFGFITLLKKNRLLACFSLLFILALRVRINERIHMAPYYLFSYWMLAIAITITLEQIQKKKMVILNLMFLAVIVLTVLIFIGKNDYDFNQIAYNRFSYGYEKTTAILMNIDKNQNIIAITPYMAAYYWESKHLPYGYFINYYPWYTQAPKLKATWQNDLENYQGNYLIVGKDFWTNYLNKKTDWLDSTLEYINNNFEVQNYPNTNDFIFKRKHSEVQTQ